MFTRSAHLLLVTLGLLAAVGPALRARAQTIEVQAHSKRKIAATHGEDPSAAGTTLDLRDRVTLPRSLGDVVRESPGAQVQSAGGMGAFTSLSLRGAAAEETWVLLDEIPLSSMDGGAFDLSLFPAELFESVNTFRGGAPVWLGAGAVGGVLQLVPHRGRRNAARVSAAAGSFGTYQVDGGVALSLPSGLSSHSQLVVRGTQGDYPYLDDRGTRFVREDDREFRLRNADWLEASGLQDTRIALRRGTLHLVALGVLRSGGFPGSPKNPALHIRRESARALVGGAYELEGGDEGAFKRRLQLVASGAFGVDRFEDRYGEQGTTSLSASDNRNFRAFVRGAGSLELVRWLEATAIGSYAYDVYLPHDAYQFPQPRDSDRHTAAGALELVARGALGGVRFELRPSARIEWTHAEVHGRRRGMPEEARTHALALPTARLGLVIEPVRGIALSGSAATGKRAPSFVELFGDGGLLISPNLSLEPVSSTTYDGGVTLRGRIGILRGRAELRGFFQERRDAIIAERTNQQQLIYRNVASVEQWGLESSLSGSLGALFHLSGSLTTLQTETGTGKRLPLRPRYVGYVRPEVRLQTKNAWVSSASLSSELWHRSFSFYDNANLSHADACTKLAFGAALGVLGDRFRVSARMDDSLDARCTDLLNYPLPGRSLFFSLTYTGVDDDDA